jgi:hypothetical protein
MRSCRLSLLGVAIAVAMVAGLRPAAAAKNRIVVLEIRGTLSEDMRDDIVAMIARRHQIISVAEYDKLAKKLRATAINNKNVAKVAGRLEAEGVVHGWITTAKDDSLLLRLRVRRGRNGAIVKKFAIRLSKERLSKAVKTQIRKRLLSAIADLDRKSGSSSARANKKSGSQGRVVKSKSKSKGKTKSKSKSKKRRKKKRKKKKRVVPVDHGDDENPFAHKGGGAKKSEKKSKKRTRVAMADDDDIELDLDDDDDDFDDDKPAARIRARDDDQARTKVSAASVDVGLSVMSRSLAFNSRADLSNAPTGYQGPMVPAVHLAAEFYPGLLDGPSKGLFSRIGAGVVVDRVFGLETAVEGATAAINLPTTQMRYGVDVRYRHQLGKHTLVGSLGFNRLDFMVDKQAAPTGVVVDVPNTAYSYFDPGIELTSRIAEKIKVGGSAKLLLVTSTGEVQHVEQYGAGTVTGFDLGVEGSYQLFADVAVTASASYMTFAYEFHGNGELSANRDGDPNTIDVAGASDRYIGAYLSATYAF